MLDEANVEVVTFAGTKIKAITIFVDFVCEKNATQLLKTSGPCYWLRFIF